MVGAGTSGAEIALELANDGFHRVTLAGRPTVHVPNVVLERAGALYWWFVDSVLTTSTLPGRKAAAGFHRRGAPLIRISMKQLSNAGAALLPRIDRVESGLPTLADGSQIGAQTIIWATGYRPDYQWITGLETDSLGWPLHDRGVSASSPGLYFAGIPFQYALTSGLIGGVGRDAAYVANLIAQTAIAHT
ncbi:NAD(P)-binding domain-containing protein [Glaciibacter superstes]|uniref:NAD(P)-binding domain-containing protein n=1 Tax=Glaciibacter superstes TaxID=501023 RepID=UPI0004150CD4|nr:NAD(P)-binding domain-containing protein [Glaciibacter superstes]